MLKMLFLAFPVIGGIIIAFLMLGAIIDWVVDNKFKAGLILAAIVLLLLFIFSG